MQKKYQCIILLICGLSISGCAGLHTSITQKSNQPSSIMKSYYINPREVELKITYELKGIKLVNSDTVTLYEFSEEPVFWKMEKNPGRPILLLYIARQSEQPNQRNVEYLSISPQPDRITAKDIDGNIIEFWDLSNQVEEGKDITITRHFKFIAYETAFKINPARVGSYDMNDPMYKYYTRTQEFIELTPEVVQLAKEIIGSETNPYYQAKAIYTWCINNIAYVYPPNRGIRFSLPRKTGDCGEYSLIFTALCRAVGIPARVVNGHWCCAAKKNYHVWNEFYLPNYGWIPADATDGRTNIDAPGKLAGNGDPYYFFGNLDSGRFISSKGTSIQLEPSPPWHDWGFADTNRNPIFFQTAATVYSGLTIEKQGITMEIIKGNDILW
ncbi:MAG: transglutaminase domain-containing protein [bacterium]|nr:transglutaminase domain-containing protein [bacterium]